MSNAGATEESRHDHQRRESSHPTPHGLPQPGIAAEAAVGLAIDLLYCLYLTSSRTPPQTIPFKISRLQTPACDIVYQKYLYRILYSIPCRISSCIERSATILRINTCTKWMGGTPGRTQLQVRSWTRDRHRNLREPAVTATVAILP